MLSLMVMSFGLVVMCLYNFSWGVVLAFIGVLFIASMLLGYSEMIFTWGLSYGLGMDLLSWSLVSLSIWVSVLMLLASYLVFKGKVKDGMFVGLVLILMITLIGTFLVTDLLYFYIMFESSLIPTFLLILGWGYQPERLQAGVYLLFYTLTASLPLLFSLFLMSSIFGSLNFLLLNKIFMDMGGDIIWYMISVIAFFVKMPMFFVHLWLPKAHVEAPVAGSMILAGVLLKLGGYGLFRFMKFFIKAGLQVNFLFISVGILGGVMISFMCFRQFDLSGLIAYSSVAHMGLVLGGILSMNIWGFQGGLVLMLGHGLCSSGLFCAANMFYERVGSRSMVISKGLMNFFPSLTMLWFLLCVGNMAAPPSLNLLGEISLFISLLGWSGSLVMGLMGLSFFSAVYTLIMYCSTQHGKCVLGYSFVSVSCREYLVLFLHLVPLNFLVIKCDLGFWWV